MYDIAQLLTEEEAAKRLNIAPGTLRNWRREEKGPKPALNPDTGRFIGYSSAAVDDWIRRVFEGEASST